MNNTPTFKFFLSSEQNPVVEDSEIWHDFLPVNRKHLKTDSENSVRYGDYFSALCSFLRKNKFHTLLTAAAKQIKNVTLDNIDGIRIYLEKHGELYHPARVKISVDNHTIQLVVNVAISETGKAYIKREAKTLQKLNTEFPYSFIPKIYGQDEISLKDNTKIHMFLGQWFEDYNEIHLSGPLDSEKLVVWDPAQGNYFLSKDQTEEFYKQATSILTCYYNTETFAQIHSWHHAAGDFILNLQDGKMDVKLITVRKYSFQIKDECNDVKDQDPQSILEALLVFFLNLSIKMRLDRIDGVGDITWSQDIAVSGIIKGFFNALSLKPPLKSISAPLDESFQYYLSSYYDESDLYDLSMNIVNAYPPQSPDIPVIKKNLKKHIHELTIRIQDGWE